MSPIGRLVRGISLRVLAFCLRHSIDPSEARDLLAKAFPHRDDSWRKELLQDALTLNANRRRR